KTQDIFHEVGDSYLGIKKHVSLGDPIAVPFWIAIPIIIILTALICASAFFYIKKPKHIDPYSVKMRKGKKNAEETNDDSRTVKCETKKNLSNEVFERASESSERRKASGSLSPTENGSGKAVKTTKEACDPKTKVNSNE
ncbi:unnamed protein product, partial [Strongylus vulgaris]